MSIREKIKKRKAILKIQHSNELKKIDSINQTIKSIKDIDYKELKENIRNIQYKVEHSQVLSSKYSLQELKRIIDELDGLTYKAKQIEIKLNTTCDVCGKQINQYTNARINEQNQLICIKCK